MATYNFHKVKSEWIWYVEQTSAMGFKFGLQIDFN